MAFLEIACFSPESAQVASGAGADRIELCDSAELGGTTPDYKSLSKIRELIKIPVFIMVRPRGGDFAYSDTEFVQMKDSIRQFKNVADGFVFGILLDSSKIDIPRTSELVSLAHPLPCTFHRAFDETLDLYEALEDVIRCGMRTILSSGGRPTALEGCDVLAELVERARGRISIMPGASVRSSNIETLKERTRASLFHSSALVGSEQVASLVEIQKLKVLTGKI